jgi:pimeloyl-ACP methyl ester carboxylesterase
MDLFMEFEYDFLETNGIRLHVVQAGPRSGIPVILLHGFPEHLRCWIHQIPALAAAGFRVIVPDQRGYNLSDKPQGIKSYRVNELVKDILGLIDSLEYQKVNLVGHDWGAGVAWMLAYQHPHRLQRLGIINVPHPLVFRRFITRDFEQMRRSWYAFFFQLPWLPELGMRANNWRGAVRALRGSGKIHTFTDEDIEKNRKAWSQPGAMTAMINWYRAVRYQNKLPSEMQIKVPTLMMWGVKDVALSHRMARPSIDHCEDGKLIFFPDSTHWVQHEAAEEVNHYLIDFLMDRASKQAIR